MRETGEGISHAPRAPKQGNTCPCARVVVTPEEMRGLERDWIARAGISSYALMERAARAVADAVLAETASGALFLLGPGNNAGDGYAAARMVAEAGRKVCLWAFGPPETLPPDARRNRERCASAGLAARTDFREGMDVPEGIGVMVDALFGTGFSRPLAPPYDEAVRFLNAQTLPVLAVDRPSGDDSLIVRAKKTVTFHACKTCHLFGPGRAASGEVVVADLGMPRGPSRDTVLLLDGEHAEGLLPARPLTAHKGTCGHALIVAGSLGMAGAAALCAEAALRAGAGLVTALCPPEVLPIVQGLVPCAMARPLEQMEEVLKGKTAIAVGPGLGRGPQTAAIVERLRHGLSRPLGGTSAVPADCPRDVPCPQVWDADALHALADSGNLRLADDIVITPHPGEAARLLKTSAEEVAADPLAAARALRAETRATVVLKGATTVVVGRGGCARPSGACAALYVGGSPGMATGGTGDVLTGLIAGLLAQRVDPFTAARAAVFHHGQAGARAAAARGVRSMTAGDLLAAVRVE